MSLSKVIDKVDYSAYGGRLAGVRAGIPRRMAGNHEKGLTTEYTEHTEEDLGSWGVAPDPKRPRIACHSHSAKSQLQNAFRVFRGSILTFPSFRVFRVFRGSNYQLSTTNYQLFACILRRDIG